MIYLTKIRNDLSLGSKRGAIIAYRESIKSNCDHYPMKLLRFCLISDLPKVLSPKQRALEEKESIPIPITCPFRYLQIPKIKRGRLMTTTTPPPPALLSNRRLHIFDTIMMSSTSLVFQVVGYYRPLFQMRRKAPLFQMRTKVRRRRRRRRRLPMMMR